MSLSKSIVMAAALIGCAPFAVQAQPYRTDNFLSTPTSGWVVNGPATFNDPGGYRTTGSTASSLISNISIPAFAPNVDVTGYVRLTPGSDSGTYVIYARATANALYGPSSATGTFLALVVQANATAGACSSTWSVVKKGAAGVSTLWTSTVDCWSDNHLMVPELVSRDGTIFVYNWSRHLATLYDGEALTGTPGFGGWGMGAASGFPYVDLWRIDYDAPVAMPASSVAVSTTPYRVDFQFPGTVDSPGGKGMAYYVLSRAPQGTSSWVTVGELVISFGQFADKGVLPGTAYTYKIDSYDYCGNFTTTQFNATTPPAGTVEPRRTGMPPTAVTWGALGV
jgi:hypothetical protein